MPQFCIALFTFFLALMAIIAPRARADVQSFGSTRHAMLMTPAHPPASQIQLVACSRGELNECANTLNECRTAAGDDKDEKAACGKEMGRCIDDCGKIPRDCRWENIDSVLGRFTCGH